MIAHFNFINKNMLKQKGEIQTSLRYSTLNSDEILILLDQN